MGKLYCLAVGCGDASIITVENATFLVDCYNIEDHSEKLPTSKKIRGVFITHPHRDHYSGLQYLLDNNYSIDELIHSPYKRRQNDNSLSLEEWNEFNKLVSKFKNKGTSIRTPFKQTSWDKAYWSTNGVSFEIIGPDKAISEADTREVHDACLVIKAKLGKRSCLFTGDASDKNLESIQKNLKNYCNDILHASHHASINGAHLEFIKKCNAKYTMISTKSGVHSNVPHPTALKRYRDNTKNKVYRTDVDGTWTWTF